MSLNSHSPSFGELSQKASKPSHMIDCTRLTFHERQVLEAKAGGCKYSQIAVNMKVSMSTIQGHAQNIISKLGAHDITEAVAIAIRTKIIA